MKRERRSTKKINDKNTTLKNFESAIKRDDEDQPKPSKTVYDRGWTLEKAVKLIGKIRLRQIRVKNGTRF